MSKISYESPEDLFEITEVLGEGSYANVYKGICLKTKKTVAVKILPINDDISELKKEIDILENCDNENIVKYYGCYQDKVNEDFWIVMEYCEAGSISDMMGICNILVKENQIAAIMKEILLGLRYLHKRHLIHRDIKGGNILLNNKGHVKITDFGVSAKLANTYSKRNTAIGTPYWMAPEVLTENEYNNKADMWSLGITAIELALGSPPFSEMHPMKAVFMIPKKPPPRLPSNFTKKFRNFVKMLLNKDPNERPTADELLKHPFIRSAGSNVILKKLYKKCIPEIKKFRENYEIDTEKSTLKKSTKKLLNDDDDDLFAGDTGTVLINTKDDDDNKDSWESSLRFNDDDLEEDDDFLNDYQNTIVINKTETNRKPEMEKFDFTEPRPLRKKPGIGGNNYHDTFEFYGRVPKRGHKYVADYYNTLTVSDLNEILLEMENSLKDQHKQLDLNHKEERNIVEYVIRLKNGEQSVKIPE